MEAQFDTYRLAPAPARYSGFYDLSGNDIPYAPDYKFTGVVSYDMLRNGRKFAIVGVFVVAAILTPPDPISQIAMAVPLMGLYEVSVQAVRFLENRRKKKREAEDAV